jgi:hypothetical protein
LSNRENLLLQNKFVTTVVGTKPRTSSRSLSVRLQIPLVPC